jgi:hypothetical protein
MKTIFKLLGLAGLLLFSSQSNAQCIISTNGNQAICCGGGSVTLSATMHATTCPCNNYDYTWSPGVGLSGTTGSAVVASPSTTTHYTVCGTAYTGTCSTICCTACAVITVSVSNVCCRITGIKELAGPSEIQVFPNPAKNVLNIELDQKSDETTVALYDIAGKMVMEKKVTEKSFSINTQPYARGIYLLKVYDSNKQIAIRKIILE